MLNLSDLYLLSPQLSMVFLALIVMALDLFVKRRIVTASMAIIGLIVPLGFAISQVFLVNPSGEHAFYGMLVVDQFALFFNIRFLVMTAIIILSSYNYLGKYVRAEGEFYTLLLFSVTGMMFLSSTSELLTIYIALELTSIPLYVMAGLLRTSERSAEAAVKYILLGAMSSAILLYGFALLYGLSGTTDLTGIAYSIEKGVQNGNALLLIASGLVIAGFGFKIS